ncbi:RNA-dependent RNA polymerase [Arlivirus sp. virus]|uniref:RNA-directed RNA polymerase L n=1 Tax=Arlivirus sp. virus TaxID=2809160 RepID=A0AAX1PCV8_9MONO|nr:RNA-dependent RNA polymerase [Arlivirus sp. virus]QXV86525.1 RNA-dependent RNA polymerase [Arlivirus sp. virus]
MDLDSLEDLHFDDNYQPSPEYDPDLHLQEAIRSDIRRHIISHLFDKSYPIPITLKQDSNILSQNDVPKNQIVITNEHIYPLIWDISGLKIPPTEGVEFNDILDESKIYRPHVDIRDLSIPLKIAKEMSIISLQILDNYSNCNSRNTQDSIKNYTPCQEILTYHRLRLFWYTIRNKMYLRMRRGQQVLEKFETIYKTINYVYILNHVILLEINQLLYMLDYGQVLMIHDTITSRYLSLLTCHLAPHFKLNHLPSINGLLELYHWGDKIIKEDGNQAYDIIKTLEPVCVGIHLDRYDTLSISHSFFKELVEKQTNERSKIEIKNLYNLIDKNSPTPSHIFEFFGCYRHFGHPTVNEELGCEKMKEQTRMENEIDEEVVQQITGAWNRFFIINFIRKNHRWPQCQTHLPPDHLLSKLINNGVTHMDEYMHTISLEDWSTITYDQEFEFDYFPDFLELLSDKSLSPYLLNWYRVYNRDLINVSHTGVMKESRRVLMEILNRKEVNVELICKTIKNRKIPDSWKVIGLHAKERELKIPARLFAMMVLEMRLYFCCTESNIARTIFKYMPCQTMNWRETDLLRHIHNVTQPTRKQDYVTITISLDFEKWNNRWRKESTDPIFKNIDDLLGQKGLYTYSHEFFKSSYYYLSSHLNPPSHLLKKNIKSMSKDDPKMTFRESQTTWAGQDGGCEGLRQKGWTTVTSGSLLAAEYILGIKSIITGQGDNQVIVAFFPVPTKYEDSSGYLTSGNEELRKEIQRYLIFLKKISAQIGMNIKLEETWVSQHLFNYGKEILSHGVFLTSVLKKISRMFISVSDNYPSLSNRIAAIHTAGHSACLKGVDPFLPYFLAVLEITNLVILEDIEPVTTNHRIKLLKSTSSKRFDVHFLLFLNMYPKDYGGYPVMCVFDYLYRGHPDPITSWLTWLKYASKYNGMALRIMQWIISCNGISSKIDYKMIIQDPVSLNWARPVNGVNVIKNSLEATLRDVTKNEQIRLLLRGVSKTNSDAIIDYLAHTTPFSPRVLNTIFRNSPEGARMDFISTFTDMRTLKNVTNKKAMHQLREKLLDCDVKWFEFIRDRYQIIVEKSAGWNADYTKSLKSLKLRQSDILSLNYCTTQIAQYLRNMSWRKEIEHVTVPHPLDQTILVSESPHTLSNPSDLRLTANLTEMFSECVTFIYHPNGPSSDKVKIDHINNCFANDPRFRKGPFSPYYGSGTAPKISSRLLSFPKTDRSLVAAQSLLKTKMWVTKEGGSFSTFLSALIKSRSPLPEDVLKAATGSFSGGSVAHRFDDVVTKHESRPNMRVNFFSQVYISSDSMGKYSRGLENYTIHFQGLFLAGLFGIQHHILHSSDFDTKRVFYQYIRCNDCCQLIEEKFLENDYPAPNITPITKCKLLFSEIPDIGKKIIWKDTGGIELLSTTSPSSKKIIIDGRSLAAGWMLLGESSSREVTLIHSPLKKLDQVRATSDISIASCLEIGVTNIIYSMTKLWLIENIEQLLYLSYRLKIDLFLVARSWLIKSSDLNWSGLRDLLLHPDILKTFLKETGIFPGSSNAFRGGNSLDILISNFATTCIKQIITQRDFGVALFCTTTNVNVLRVILIWIKSSSLIAYFDKPARLQDCIKRIKKVITLCTKQDEFRLEEFILSLNSVRQEFKKYPSPLDYPIVLSQEGAEPWVKFKLPMSIKPSVFDHLSIHIKSDEDKSSVLDNIGRLSIINVNRVNKIVDRDVLIPSEEPIDLRCLSTKRVDLRDDQPYLEHMIKITGAYSSSHYKFISLLYQEGLHSVKTALCLGDGDGGVTRLLSVTQPAETLWYNSLIDISTFPPHRAIGYIPPELLGLPNLQKIRGIDLCIKYGGDFTDPDYQELLLRDIGETPLDLVVMDAETGKEFSIDMVMKMVNSVIVVCKRNTGTPVVIFKTYMQNIGYLDIIINQFLLLADSVKLVTPLMSSFNSQECFIIFKAIRKPKHKLSTSSYWKSNYSFQEEIGPEIPQLSSVHNTKFLTSKKVLQEGVILNKYFESLGYISSLSQSLQILTGDHLDYGKFLVNRLTSLAMTAELINNIILNRMESYGQIILGSKISRSQYQMRGTTGPESKDLNIMCSFLFNIKLMILGARGAQITDLVFDMPIQIKHKGQVVYQWVPEYREWMKKFGRAWYKYYGWILQDSEFRHLIHAA